MNRFHGMATMNRALAAGLTALSLAAAALLAADPLTAGPPAGAVTVAQDLSAQVAAARPGTVLMLDPGDHGTLRLKGFTAPADNPVTLRSRDPAHPARITAMDIRASAGLVLEELVFDYRYRMGDKGHLRPFQVQDSRDVTFRRVIFDGDIAGSGEGAGFPTAFGLSLRKDHGIVLEDSEILNFYRGLVASDSTSLTIRRNDVHSIRMDGMNFAQVDDVRIEDNWIHDFKRAVDSPDHADMIQFWTNGTEWASRNIVIRNNVLNSGLGAYTQSIFMRNDLVDRGLAGSEMYYRNIVIEENVIVNAHLHGITVGETRGLTIRNNTLIHNAQSDGAQQNDALWRPQIRVVEDARDVIIRANAAHRLPKAPGRQDWVIQNNLEIQDQRPGRSNHVHQLFAAAQSGDPRELHNFRYRPDGALALAHIGASRLHPGSAGRPAPAPIPSGRGPGDLHGPPPANPFTAGDRPGTAESEPIAAP